MKSLYLFLTSPRPSRLSANGILWKFVHVNKCFCQMDMITTLLVVLVLTLLLILWKKTSRDARYPPGPPTLPFLGNLNMNTADMVGEFRRFRQRYGDVFSLILGTKTVVVVSGYDTLKDLFVKHADIVSGRPDVFIFKDVMKNGGIVL